MIDNNDELSMFELLDGEDTEVIDLGIEPDEYEDDIVDDVEQEEDSEDFEFDFSQFYQEEEESKEEEAVNPEELGLYSNEESYDEILDLHNDAPVIAVEAKYPYIRISGFKIKDEISFMQAALTNYIDSIIGKYDSDDMLDLMLNIGGEDYNVGRAPMVLDTFLTIFRAHRYNVSIVQSESSEMVVTSELMKAFIFT